MIPAIQALKEKIQKKQVTVAIVSRQTGIDAARIYKWIQGKGNPKLEDNKKLELFLQGENMLHIKKDPQVEDLQVKYTASLESQITLLRADNKRLQDHVDVNLKSISASQSIVLGYLKTLLQVQGEQGARLKGQDAKRELEQINKLLGQNLQGAEKGK